LLKVRFHELQEAQLTAQAGSHATYAHIGCELLIPGSHRSLIAFSEIDFSGTGLVHDACDKGPRWDPALNMQTFIYAPKPDRLLSLDDPPVPTGFLLSRLIWGDKQLPAADPRQSIHAQFSCVKLKRSRVVT
jgi:hypothetical protein